LDDSKYVKEILKIYLIEQKIYPNHIDEWYVWIAMVAMFVNRSEWN